jgi:hypothetical protein
MFKIGDRVMCIAPAFYGELSFGYVYTVSNVDPPEWEGQGVRGLVLAERPDYSFFQSRFKLALTTIEAIERELSSI